MTDKTVPARPQTPADANCYPADSEFKSGRARPFQPVYTFGTKSGATSRPESRRVRFKGKGE